MLSFGVGDFLK